MIYETKINVLKDAIKDAIQDPGKMLTVHMSLNNDEITSHMSCNPEDIEFSCDNIMSIYSGDTEINIDLTQCKVKKDTDPDDVTVDESIELVGSPWVVNLDFIS